MHLSVIWQGLIACWPLTMAGSFLCTRAEPQLDSSSHYCRTWVGGAVCTPCPRLQHRGHLPGVTDKETGCQEGIMPTEVSGRLLGMETLAQVSGREGEGAVPGETVSVEFEGSFSQQSSQSPRAVWAHTAPCPWPTGDHCSGPT